MLSLSHRVDQNELMDDPGISFPEFQQTLGEIEKINRMTGAYRPTLKAIESLAKKPRPDKKTLRILDIGFGNGDFLRHIADWAKQKGIAVDLTGVDLNPWAECAAQATTPLTLKIQYVTRDIFEFVPPEPYHIIINSLFTHHLTHDEIVRVMQWMMRHASLGWFINDLHRHIIPYFFIRSYVRCFSFNRLVRHDAPLSVARAFTRQDWQGLTHQAKLSESNVQISWHWPFRYGVFYAH